MKVEVWHPIVEGALSQRCGVVLRDLADLLRLDANPQATGGVPAVPDDLFGVPLFYVYLDLAEPDRGYREEAVAWLTYLMARSYSNVCLHDGVAGIAWVAAHLQRLGVLSGIDLDEIDAVLLRVLGSSPRHSRWDLSTGWSGLGIYFVERCARVSQEALSLVIARLADLAESPGDGGSGVGFVAWPTGAELLNDRDRALYPDGLFNLSLSHGCAGVAFVLALVLSSEGLADGRSCGELLSGAVQWLLHRRLRGDGAPHMFPDRCSELLRMEKVELPERSAWCRGDLGVIGSLSAIEDWVPRERLRSELRQVVDEFSHRDLAGMREDSVIFCHGSAGAAHVFNRLYHQSGLVRFRELAENELTRTLDLCERGHLGEGGALSWRVDTTENAPRWYQASHPGLLLGAAGVGLTLLAATTDIAPSWDRVLGLSTVASGEG
jgi:lantibiotic modifying enzyme